MKKRWSYAELPEGWYCATIDEYQGGYIFRAMPNRGNVVAEGIFTSPDEVSDAARRFAAGETGIPGIYGYTA